VLAEKMIDEPDARGAGEVANAQGKVGGGVGGGAPGLGLGDSFGEFVDLVSGRFGVGGGLQDTPTEEIVEGAKASRLDKVVHDAAARAAELFGFKARLESVPAMVSTTMLEL